MLNPGRSLFRPSCVFSKYSVPAKNFDVLAVDMRGMSAAAIDCSPPVPLLGTRALFSVMPNVRRCQPCAAASPDTTTVSTHLANLLLKQGLPIHGTTETVKPTTFYVHEILVSGTHNSVFSMICYGSRCHGSLKIAAA